MKHQFFLPVFFMVSLLMGSCQSSAPTEESPESLRNQISEYKTQINELSRKIQELDRRLEQMGEQPMLRDRIPVETTIIDYQPFTRYFQTAATVEAVETAMISPEISGQIKQIMVVKGQSVKQGELLARLNTASLENSIQEVKTSLNLARTLFERQENLWNQQIGSEMQYLEARHQLESLESRLGSMQAQLDMASLRAPFDGIIDEIYLKTGELAMPGAPVMNLVNLNRLYINAEVSESQLAFVNRGDKVILRFPAFPEFQDTVRIHRTGHVIQPENRTFRVQLLINNPAQRIKPNMMASISIPTQLHEQSIVIPSILIRQDNQGHFVFTARMRNQEWEARRTYIEPGAEGEGLTMVNRGLQKGDRLIIRGQNQVNEGSLITQIN